jgi:hypothetical protein
MAFPALSHPLVFPRPLIPGTFTINMKIIKERDLKG